MPTYEYACTQCGNRFDRFQSIHEESLSVCEVCGGALRKVFHPAGIVLKGSGFYKTDSRKTSTSSTSSTPSKPKAKPGGDSTSSGSSTSSSGSSSSAPASTAGSKE